MNRSIQSKLQKRGFIQSVLEWTSDDEYILTLKPWWGCPANSVLSSIPFLLMDIENRFERPNYMYIDGGRNAVRYFSLGSYNLKKHFNI